MASFGPGLGVGTTVETGEITTETILDEDISTTAAIARSKIATGTASHVVINSGTGAFSSEASLAVARGGTALTALGTGLQVLRTNSGASAMEWAAAGANEVNVLADTGGTTTSGTEVELATLSISANQMVTIQDFLLVEINYKNSTATSSFILRVNQNAVNNNSTLASADSGHNVYQARICSDMNSTSNSAVEIFANKGGTLSGISTGAGGHSANWNTGAWTISLRGSTSGTLFWHWKVYLANVV